MGNGNSKLSVWFSNDRFAMSRNEQTFQICARCCPNRKWLRTGQKNLRLHIQYKTVKTDLWQKAIWLFVGIKIQQMQQYADIYLLQSYLHVLGVTAAIIRSIKNCTRSLRYKSYYLHRYSPPTWSDRNWFFRLVQTSPDQTTLEGSSGASSMTCTGGCGYSF